MCLISEGGTARNTASLFFLSLVTDCDRSKCSRKPHTLPPETTAAFILFVIPAISLGIIGQWLEGAS